MSSTSWNDYFAFIFTHRSHRLFTIDRFRAGGRFTRARNIRPGNVNVNERPVAGRRTRVTLVRKDEPGPRGSRAVQGRQGRGTVGTAEHEGRTHRRPAAAGAVPIKLKIAEVTAVHPAVALVRLAFLLQHHTPPFCPRVLEPDLRGRQAESWLRASHRM